MSAVIRQFVMRKRAAQAAAEANAERYAALIAEARGADGQAPAHEWDGTKLRFQNPDGTWGEWVDLRGKPGKKGDKGEQGESGRVLIRGGGGGGGLDPASIPPAGSIVGGDFLIIERAGGFYRIDAAQFVNGGSSGDVVVSLGVTVDGEKVVVS